MAKKREKIKTDILRIAKKKFAETGYEATNIQDIATEAKINIAMISYYFGGKEQLYQEIFTRLKLPQNLPNYMLAYPDEPTNALKHYLDYMFKHLETEQEIGVLIYQELLAPNSRLHTIIPYITCVVQQLCTILQAGKEKGEFHYDSLSFIMHWIGSFIIFPRYQLFLYEVLEKEMEIITNKQKIKYIIHFLKKGT